MRLARARLARARLTCILHALALDALARNRLVTLAVVLTGRATLLRRTRLGLLGTRLGLLGTRLRLLGTRLRLARLARLRLAGLARLRLAGLARLRLTGLLLQHHSCCGHETDAFLFGHSGNRFLVRVNCLLVRIHFAFSTSTSRFTL